MGARRVGWAIVIALVSVSTALAQTRDNKQLAKELYVEGTRLYDLNDYGKALESFKKAYLSFEEPSLLFNIAQCQRQLGQKDEAIKTYRSFLRKLPNASNRAEVQRLITKLEEALENERQANRMPPQGVDPKPEPVVAPAPVAAPPTPAVATTEPVAAVDHAVKPKPIYKKWWLWTIVGVVVVGGAVGAGVGIALSGSSFKKTLPDTGPGASMALRGLEIRF